MPQQQQDATTLQKAAFLKQVNWGTYTAYRPIYPPSLKTLILNHHRRHSSSVRSAHDVGAGSGVFASWLAEHFAHVHVSDPNADFVAAAREKLGLWSRQYQQRPSDSNDNDRNDDNIKGDFSFSFSVTPAEKADDVAVVGAGNLDCVSLMMSAHWTVQDAMAAAVGRSLAPGGTLVVVQINPAPRVVVAPSDHDSSVREALERLFEFWGRSVLEWKGGRESEFAQRFLAQQNAGLECLVLPPEYFDLDATERIEVNVRDRGARAHMIPGLEDLVKDYEKDLRAKRSTFTSGDVEGKGWQYEVDAEWFRGLISTMEKEERLHLYNERLAEVEDAIRSCSPNGRVLIEWTVAILLATRK